ncbi:MAG TPA: DUF2306 domain-containing protein [Rudaea sp.]|nr:DUF2306 domain-containing protein [Rudaea sp.]
MTVATPQAVAASGILVPRRGASADAVLAAAARLWFVTAVVGQWAFLYYIAAFYDAATLRGDFAAWSRNTFLLRGYVAGDAAGNFAFGAHVLLATIVTFGGALQLIPQLRARFIAVHRWNGRLFLLTALAAAISGLLMIWVRGSRANFIAGLATSVDAALIIAFALLAWRSARSKEIAAHRRWALRTWIVANGVWFQRVGIFGWMTFHHAAVGMTKHFDGWFDLSWAFGCFLFPLAVLELYLRVKDTAGARSRYAMAGGLLLLAAVMAFGSYSAYMFVWRPFLFRLGV